MPGGLVLAGAACYVEFGMHGIWTPVVVRVLPYAVLLAGIIFSLLFNRSRLFFAVLLIFIADRLLRSTTGIEDPHTRSVITNTALILLPLNMAFFSRVRESGFLNIQGVVRFLVISFQPVFTAFLYVEMPEILIALRDYRFLPAEIPESITFGETGLAALVISVLIILLGIARRSTPLNRGFLWAMAAVFLSLNADRYGSASVIYSGSASLILICAVIQTAWGMAYKDELTGLPARRALNDAFLKLPGRYAVAMLDIDFFKKFNDTYGHDVGDQVLAMVASKMSAVGSGGKAFRYGGEEFTIVFPGKSTDEALPALESLRERIQEAKFIVRSPGRSKGQKKNRKKSSGKRQSVSVTVSIGVAGHEQGKSVPENIVKEADKALYKAKKEGRNRIVSA